MIRSKLRPLVILLTAASLASAQPAPDAAPSSAPELRPKAALAEAPRRVVHDWPSALTFARQHLPAVSAASAMREKRRSEAAATSSGALPRLAASAGIERHLLSGQGADYGATGVATGRIPNPASTWSAGISLSVPVFVPKIWAEWGAARQETLAEQYGEQDVARRAALALADAVVDVAAAEQVAEVTRAAFAEANGATELTRRSRELGHASVVDFARMEQDLAEASALVVVADDARQASYEALGAALGDVEPWGIAPGFDLAGALARACPGGGPPEDAASRADVRAARARQAAAERSVTAAGYAYLPTIEATSGLTYWSEDRFTANGEHATWTVGGVLRWTIYDGGLHSALQAGARADEALSRSRAQDALRSARLEAAAVERELRAAERQLQAMQTARDRAVEAVRLVKLAFASGQGTTFDVIETSRRAREAETRLAWLISAKQRAHAHVLLTSGPCAAPSSVGRAP